MSQGTIKKLVYDRGFGFISGDGPEVFFHKSAVEGISFEELREGQAVEYELDQGQQQGRRNRGPRASAVRLA